MQITKNAQLWIKKAELLQVSERNEEALEVMKKAIQENVQPETEIYNYLESFLSKIVHCSTNPKDSTLNDARADSAAVVYTPARTPGRSKLGLSGTPARALRSQFDDAADVVTACVAAEDSEVAVEAAALGSTIKLASVIVDNRMTATPVRRSARKGQGCVEDATLGDRKAVLSLLHSTNFQFAPNPSLSNRRESVGMSVIVAAEGDGDQPAESGHDESQHAAEQDGADGAVDGAAVLQDNCVTASSTEAAEAAPAVATRAAPAAVVYTPARTPGRSKLGLSGTPARLAYHTSASPGSDGFYTPASSFSPSTPFGTLESPMQRSASKNFR